MRASKFLTMPGALLNTSGNVLRRASTLCSTDLLFRQCDLGPSTLRGSGLAPPPPFLLSPGRPVAPWEQWHRMFETYLLASGATEFSLERRRAILIHCLGTEGQRIFNTLPATAATTVTTSAEKFDAATTPTASADKPDATGTPTAPNVYDVAVAALRQHFASTSNVVVERHRFHRRYQSTNESVAYFVAALRELASVCSFASEEDALRDQFVAGVSSHRVP
ncbi:hypothetical protein MTO96_041523 [Rhipicephalus appendiculatus]